MADTNYFHLHLVSDATGETLIMVARAAAAQYANVAPVEHLYPMVRSRRQLDLAVNEITESPGVVLYTLLDDELSEAANAWGLSSFPYFAVLDSEGKVIERRSGELTTKQFQALLDEAAPSATSVAPAK